MNGINKIIDEIEKTRGKNNICWMDILRLAFQADRKKATQIFKKVANNDQEVNKLFKKLIEVSSK